MNNSCKLLKEFQELYDRRPIIDNSGGMKSPHLFALYSWLIEMKPDLIIESGVWKGLGTWFMRQTCPSAKIVCLDIDYSNLIYRDKIATYHNYDMSNLNIRQEIGNTHTDKILVFFDDHQNFNNRIDMLVDAGVKHVVYEDNYPMGQGDCVSPKKIVHFSKSKDTCGDKVFDVSLSECERILSHVTHYEEFPPIFKSETTRWNTPWVYDTPNPILQESENNIIEYSQMFHEKLDYTWICKMEICR